MDQVDFITYTSNSFWNLYSLYFEFDLEMDCPDFRFPIN